MVGRYSFLYPNPFIYDVGGIFVELYGNKYKPIDFELMPFEKLHPEIQERLKKLEITTPTLLQQKSIPVIKSGANIYCVAAESSGKTTTLIITTLQKLKYQAVGNAPRAIILVKDKEAALKLYESFLAYTKHTPLRLYVAHEDLHIDLQKSEIFEGVDILISTPDSLKRLCLMNGISTAALKIFSVDDAEFLSQNASYLALMSIAQGIKKCQYVLYMATMEPKLKRFESYFMTYAKTIRM